MAVYTSDKNKFHQSRLLYKVSTLTLISSVPNKTTQAEWETN